MIDIVEGRLGRHARVMRMNEPLNDQALSWPVTASEHRLAGGVVSVRSDTVRSPVDGTTFVRDVVRHPGAVAVVAIDDDERVLVVRQYRHPVQLRPVELPAGLRDVDGEPPLSTAQRELYEETHAQATDWRLLVDLLPSPGMTDEAIRVFLARGVTAVSDDRHEGVHEEADISAEAVPLADLVDAILTGQVQNSTLCAGVLAAWVARNGTGYETLRSADAPWSAGERRTGHSGEDMA